MDHRHLRGALLGLAGLVDLVAGGDDEAHIRILGHRGLLEGRTATSFPTFQKELRGANIPADAYVCVDGRYVTGRGMGVAVEFGLKLVELLAGKEASDAIRGSIQCRE